MFSSGLLFLFAAPAICADNRCLLAIVWGQMTKVKLAKPVYDGAISTVRNNPSRTACPLDKTGPAVYLP